MTEYADPDLDTVPELDLETVPPLPPVADSSAPRTPSDRGPVVAIAAALVVVSLVVGFATATIVLNARDSSSTEVTAGPLPRTPVTPAPATDPDAAVLGGLILRQSDVVAPNTVRLIDHGADLTNPTLDLCNGIYPSEAQRTARRQVALTDSQGSYRMSTEAVLYGNSAGGEQAFAELESVVEKCPSTPVLSPVGLDTATTTFRAAPDGAWPRTPAVERRAYDFVTVNADTGRTSHSIAVYLRRGRVLMGVYFGEPDSNPQTAVEGHTTIPEIVAVFEARMAKVSDRVVNG